MDEEEGSVCVWRGRGRGSKVGNGWSQDNPVHSSEPTARGGISTDTGCTVRVVGFQQIQDIQHTWWDFNRYRIYSTPGGISTDTGYTAHLVGFQQIIIIIMILFL